MGNVLRGDAKAPSPFLFFVGVGSSVRAFRLVSRDPPFSVFFVRVAWTYAQFLAPDFFFFSSHVPPGGEFDSAVPDDLQNFRRPWAINESRLLLWVA